MSARGCVSSSLWFALAFGVAGCGEVAPSPVLDAGVIDDEAPSWLSADERAERRRWSMPLPPTPQIRVSPARY
ncbi:MAG: hypothetical protein JNK72_05590, partial [Myxococcales bacterium]|nr:hypothetical protein [Myxococcales bacterium]